MSRGVVLPMLCAAVLAGCAGEERRVGAATASVHTVVVSQQCGRGSSRARATWIDDQAGLDLAVRRLRRNTLGAAPPPPVDFSTHGVVFFELGSRPSAGFQPRLASNLLVRDRGNAVLTLSVSRPGAYAAQVISSPCLLVAVPRGDYDLIEVLSTDRSVSVRTARIPR